MKSTIRKYRSTNPFQCSSASRKFLNRRSGDDRADASAFQCSSASRKFLNYDPVLAARWAYVSFSALQRAENSSIGAAAVPEVVVKFGFSALQRAENSSMPVHAAFVALVPRRFSALQRAENSSIDDIAARLRDEVAGFSALQRAENSSIRVQRAPADGDERFQCSSASRKFLNIVPFQPLTYEHLSFSALQRAENSSMGKSRLSDTKKVMFQCSSASRKFLNDTDTAVISIANTRFSALQRAENSSIWVHAGPVARQIRGFSALQRAENSSMWKGCARTSLRSHLFQCSSASRKFLNALRTSSARRRYRVSVLFSEPKIPQFAAQIGLVGVTTEFQCSSASRKFLNREQSEA